MSDSLETRNPMSERRQGTTGWFCNQGFLLAMVLIALLSILSGCGSGQNDVGQTNGNSVPVNLSITMPANVAAAPAPTHPLVFFVQRWLFPIDAWAATARDISALLIQVTGPDLPSPITHREPVRNAESGQVIPIELNVPVGQDRVFIVSALNAANQTIFHGQSESLVLTPGLTATANVQLADTTIRILTETLPDGTKDRSYTATLAAERGSGAVSWNITNGRIPPGIELNASTGAMTGTPTVAGTFPLTIRATDTAGLFDEQRLSVRINPAPIPPRITNTTLPEGTAGSRYSTTLAATGGTGAPKWSVVSGALPPGLSLNEVTGAITGTPTTEGTSKFTVRATDTIPLTGEKALSITINPAPRPPTITTPTLPNGTASARYNQTLTATGGTGAVTWSVSAGSLPPGLTLNKTTGGITGTPTTVGPFSFTVRATDTIPLSNEKPLSITIVDAPVPPEINTTTLPGGRVGDSYSATLAATSRNGAVTWRVTTTGTLPPGLNLNGSTGAITGTPTTVGTFDFTVRATDALGLTDEQALAILINDKPNPPVITTTSVPGGTVGKGYQAEVNTVGGTGDITWSIAGGTLPPGLDLRGKNILGIFNIGEIAGTPKTDGTYNFTVRATDTQGLSDSQEFSITIAPPVTITTTKLPNGDHGGLYNPIYDFNGEILIGSGFQLEASGGSGTYTWSKIEGELPPGLTLSSAGVISGTPNIQYGCPPFTYTARYEVRDSKGAVATSARLTITIIGGGGC